MAVDRAVADFLARILPHRSIWKRSDKTGGPGSCDVTDESGRVLYLRRFFLTPHWFPVRVWLHFIAKSDDDRDLHTHPWDFATFVLRNGYVETFKDGTGAFRTAGNLAFRKAEHAHRVTLFARPSNGIHGVFEFPAWTLMFARRARRAWGFVVPIPYFDTADGHTLITKHVDWREYLGLPADTPEAPEDA